MRSRLEGDWGHIVGTVQLVKPNEITEGRSLSQDQGRGKRGKLGGGGAGGGKELVENRMTERWEEYQRHWGWGEGELFQEIGGQLCLCKKREWEVQTRTRRKGATFEGVVP